MWPDDPDEDRLKLIIESPRFRVGLLSWYIADDEVWKALSEELGGSFPVEWLLTSKPPGKDLMDMRLGILKTTLEYKIAERERHRYDADETTE